VRKLLVAVLMTSLGVSGCASLGRTSALTIAIPKSPWLQTLPKERPCQDSNGERYECVLMLRADWTSVLLYIDALQRELEGACVKIGQVSLPPDWRTNDGLSEEAERLVKEGCYAK